METLAGHGSLFVSSHPEGTQPQPAAGTAAAAGGPKSCATCRLAHVSCDRKQPCGRCVRLGKTESCQPPPTRKRGRPPRKAPSIPDDHQQELQEEHQRQSQQQVPATATKRVCLRPKSTDTATNVPAPPTAASGCSLPSSFSLSSTSPSSVGEDCASLSSPSSPAQPSAMGSLPGHQRFTPLAQPAPSADPDQGLRSLLMLVVDQMRDMRRENERLHNTIAQLRATQRETERRLARVEEDHRTKSHLLEQTRRELNDHVMAHRRDSVSVRDHVHASSAFPPPPPIASSQAPPGPGSDLPLVAAVRPATSRGEVERFIAQTLPFLQEFDCSSLIIRDLQQPFLIMRTKEAETLDDMDTPVIVYASPPMCKLLGYDMWELHGSPITSIGSPRPEHLVPFVRLTLLRPPTRVSQPLLVTSDLATKQGGSVRVSTTHQMLYNRRRLVQWQIVQVKTILGAYMDSVPVMRPIPSIVHDPTVRAHLLARLPHSLLFGRQSQVASTQASTHHHQHQHHSFGSQHYKCHCHEMSLVEQHTCTVIEEHTCAVIEELTEQEEEALMAAMITKQQHQRPPGRQDLIELPADDGNNNNDNDHELDELMRILGLPIESGGGVPSSPFNQSSTWMMGFNPRPSPTTPAALAERWMR